MLNKKILFVCNDVGAAHQISCYIKFNKNIEYSSILSKTSRTIFKKNNIKLNIIHQSKIKNYDIIITGTSWRYKNEIKIIKKFCKTKKIITILDEISNLKNRFKLNKTYHYPHELWIPKNLDLPRKNFFPKKVFIKKIPNYYFYFFKKNLSKFKKNINYKKNFLYLTQPNKLANKFYGKKTYKNEKFFLNKFLNEANKYLNKNINITIRTHPSEKYDKYNSIIKRFKKLKINLSHSLLEEDLKNNYFVIGYNTNAMRLAILNKNKTISMANKKIRKEFFDGKNIFSFNSFSKNLSRMIA